MFVDGVMAVGARLVDGYRDGRSADAYLERVQAEADRCARDEWRQVGSIEPLTGLDPDAIGWRLRRVDHPVWEEYVVIKLDEWRVLGVGLGTSQLEERPVELDELIRHARAGADRFTPDADRD